mmetsp:Transcript_23281/g.31900  ORF Transcript_23281/g.31900 Transcript_23281/m.31900 type:complete len:80 (-) Transcript_23281:13-252(-)
MLKTSDNTLPQGLTTSAPIMPVSVILNIFCLLNRFVNFSADTFSIDDLAAYSLTTINISKNHIIQIWLISTICHHAVEN